MEQEDIHHCQEKRALLSPVLSTAHLLGDPRGQKIEDHRDPCGLQAFLVQSFMLEGLQGRGQQSCSDEQPTEEEMRREEKKKTGEVVNEENPGGSRSLPTSSPLTHISLSWSPLHVPLHNRPEVSISPLSIPMLSSHTEHSPLTHTNHTSLQFQH